MMATLRGGTVELGIEIGRWHGLRREDRVCKECGSGEVEDTEHFVMRCAYVVKERKSLENLMSSRVKGWHELGGNEKVLRIMDRACCNEAVARAVESLSGRSVLLQMFPFLTRLDSYFYNEVLL